MNGMIKCGAAEACIAAGGREKVVRTAHDIEREDCEDEIEVNDPVWLDLFEALHQPNERLEVEDERCKW